MSEVKYKDSGIEWIGKIPEDWTIGRIGDRFYTKKIIAGKNEKDFIRLSVTENGLEIKEDRYAGIGWNTLATYQVVDNTDNVLNLRTLNGTNPKYNRSYISNLYGIISPLYTIVRPISENIGESKLLYYFMYYVSTSGNIKYLGNNGLRNDINKKKLLSLPYPIPPLPTQHRIAEYLDKVIPNIDKQIESYETLSKKYKDLKKSEIYECVTKGLPESRARRGYKDSGIEWIGEIPEDWEIGKNAKIMHRIKDLIQEYNNETILSLSVIGMVDRYKYGLKGKTPRNYIGYQRIKNGDLVLCLFDTDVTPCCTGIAQEEGITSPAYSRMYVDESIADRGYYYYWYTNIKNMDCLYKLANNVRNSISASEFAKIKVPIPPLNEQQEISTYLDQKCVIYDSLTKLYQAKADKLKELKKSLIYEYVTGKKRVK